jgi:hypothetical protein
MAKERPENQKSTLNLDDQELFKELKNKFKVKDSTLDEIKKLKEQLYNTKNFQEFLKKYQQFTNFINELKNNPETENKILRCFMYHWFSGSTFSLEEIEDFDFKGEYSILKFVRELFKDKD